MPHPTLWSALLAMCLTLAAHAQCGQWERIIPDQPQGSISKIWYDTITSQVRTYGDHAPAGRSIWNWNGSFWTQLSLSNPTAIPYVDLSQDWRYAVAFDEHRRRLVVVEWNFGPIVRTSEWDGGGWLTPSTPVAPASREYHSLVYDPLRQRTILFGGRSANDNVTPLGDTWEWDGVAWSLLSSTGPARYGHSLAFDSARGRTVLFGGATNSTTDLADTWEWDGSVWTPRATTGPSARTLAAMGYDPVRQRTVLYGGRSAATSNAPLSDTWEWDANAWTQRPVEGPPARSNANMVFHPGTQRIVMGGGMIGSSTTGNASELWEWDGAGWTQKAPAAPPQRESHALAFDSVRAKTILFGGLRAGGLHADNHTWEYDGRWTRKATTGPSSRSDHAMAFDPVRQRTVLFGGLDSGGSVSGETWEWNGLAWQLRSTSGPAPRSGHAMVYIPSRQRVLLYGGGAPAAPAFQDVWEWDGTTWTQLPNGPVANRLPNLAYDSVRQRLVLYLCGPTDTGSINQTWEWDGTTWFQGAPLGFEQPGFFSQRSRPNIAFDTVRERTVINGGGGFSDFAEWDGVAWVSRTRNGDFTRYRTEMVYDTARSTLVMFGGADIWSTTLPVRSDTYELPSAHLPARILQNPQSQSAPHGGMVIVSVAVDGDGPFTYQWIANDSELLQDGETHAGSPARVISGANTPTLTLRRMISHHSGVIKLACRITNPCAPTTTNNALIVVLPCGSSDFDNDGSGATDADIEAFFTCLAGDCCNACGTADFNADGDTGTDADIEAFFRVLAGGTC